MLRRFKLLTIGAASSLGLSSLMLNSEWRRKRLLILCYHGTSFEDEHLWDPGLYIPASQLRERLETLKALKCNVLPLGESIERLYAGNLPERAVAITVDDGSYDFYKLAHPLLKEFGYPVTVYLTTYYSEYNRPVFDPMCSYLIWKARGRHLSWPELGIADTLIDDAGWRYADSAVKSHAGGKGLSAREKDALLTELAARLKIDLEALRRKRILHIMTPEEARELAAEGVDLQLHTHRHRTSRKHDLFVREIVDNRTRIAALSGVDARHFCYPGGFHLPEYPGWLREQGVVSSTTCEARIATAQDDPMLLPRLLDTTLLSAPEFRASISGLADFFPRRPHVMGSGQLLEAQPGM